MRPTEKIRITIADLSDRVALIQSWRETQGETTPDQVSDELLDACKQLLAGALCMDDSAEQHLQRFNFADIKTHIDNAVFRVAAASIAQIDEDSNTILKEVGEDNEDILHECLPEYSEFSLLLYDAVPMANRAQNFPEDRARFLQWAVKHLKTIISLHRRLLACEKAAISKKWRRSLKKYGAITAFVAAVLTIIGFFIQYFIQ